MALHRLRRGVRLVARVAHVPAEREIRRTRADEAGRGTDAPPPCAPPQTGVRNVTTEKEERKAAAKDEYNVRKFVSKEERKKRNRISFLEKGIAEIEAKMKEIESVLSNPGEKDDIMELTRTYLENKRELDAKTEEWASLVESLDE